MCSGYIAELCLCNILWGPWFDSQLLHLYFSSLISSKECPRMSWSFLGNIPCPFLVLVPLTGNEQGLTQGNLREFLNSKILVHSLTLVHSLFIFWIPWDSWGIHKELVGESKDLSLTLPSAPFSAVAMSAQAQYALPDLTYADCQALYAASGCYHCWHTLTSPGWTPHLAHNCVSDAAHGIPPYVPCLAPLTPSIVAAVFPSCVLEPEFSYEGSDSDWVNVGSAWVAFHVCQVIVSYMLSFSCHWGTMDSCHSLLIHLSFLHGGLFAHWWLQVFFVHIIFLPWTFLEYGWV